MNTDSTKTALTAPPVRCLNSEHHRTAAEENVMKATVRKSFLLGIFFLISSLVAAGQVAPPFNQCPSVGADASCAILIIVTDNGISVASDPSQGPFDQVEDTLIGVQNNSSQTLLSLPLSAAVPVFGFDGDGLCAFITCTWPHPTSYEGETSAGGAASFTGINTTGTAGIVNFAGGIPPNGSAFFSLEESIQTLCNPLDVQPKLKQGDVPWGPLQYDNAPLWVKPGQHTTIARWGCYLTSAVMLINYQAQQQNNSFRTTPEDLNNWLEAHSQPYETAGNVWDKDVEAYVKAQTNGTLQIFFQGKGSRNDFVVDNFLCTNNPVILQVPIAGSTHFVLATGQTMVAGISTFLINDPNYAENDLSGKYGFRYLDYRAYSATQTPPQALLFTAHSPIELLATDPLGNLTGFDPVSGLHFNEIPSSDYSTESILDDVDPTGGGTTPEVKNLEILDPISGTYNLKVVGTGSGSYSIDFDAHDSNGDPHVATVTGSTIPGATTQFSVGYSSLGGSPILANQIVTLDSLIADITAAQAGHFIEDEFAQHLLKTLKRVGTELARGKQKKALGLLCDFLKRVGDSDRDDIQRDAKDLLKQDTKALILAVGGKLCECDCDDRDSDRDD